MPKGQCNARTRRGTHCRRPAMPDHWRCRLHAGRPKGTPAHPNTIAALRAGRERWLQKMRLAKTAGLIEKLPNGRKPRGSPKRSANRVIARAQRVLEERTMMLSGKDTGAALPAAAPGEPAVAAGKARNAMSKSEKQSANTDLALDVNHAVLSAPVDLNDLKRARLQVDCAVSTINQQVRIDQAQMRQQSEENAVAILMRRLAQHDVGTPVTHDGYPPGGVEKDAAAPPPGSSPRRG